MRQALRHPVFARLFGAQLAALLGTGLLTVALGLLAVEIAGPDAGMVLGTAWTIRIVAYVVISPIMAALVSRLPRIWVLITADVVRAGMAMCLPFVEHTWHIYLLIFGLQAASATFSPAFQATIPQVLPDEEEYTAALSLSRLAYDVEALVSPALAALLLTVLSYHDLFLGTAIGFIVSIILVAWARPPAPAQEAPTPFVQRLTLGLRIFIRTGELRGLLALNLTVASAIAMVLINTVVLVQQQLGAPSSAFGGLLAAYGTGSMVVALLLPRLLNRVTDTKVMAVGGIAAPSGLILAAGAMTLHAGLWQWVALTVTWAVLGAATSLILTPSARLLRRNATTTEQPAVFAAQFSLSHACYLLTYPAAGWLGSKVGLVDAAAILAALAAAAAFSAGPLSGPLPPRRPA